MMRFITLYARVLYENENVCKNTTCRAFYIIRKRILSCWSEHMHVPCIQIT